MKTKNSDLKLIIIVAIIVGAIIFWPRKYDACECGSYIRSNGTLSSGEMIMMGYDSDEIAKQKYCLTKYSTKELMTCY